MSAAGAPEALEPNVAIPHEEWLLRLNFNPEHIVDGAVIPSAVSLTDLKSRGYSVDREKLVDLTVVSERASTFSEKKPGATQNLVPVQVRLWAGVRGSRHRRETGFLR